MEKSLPVNIPHVLIFPYPAQGHVNSMLKLAELLCLSGLNVTFINTEYIHSSLLRHTDAGSRFSQFSGFRFETIPDGLDPDNQLRSVGFVSLSDMFDQLKNVIKPAFREMMISGRLKSDDRGQVTCIIADGILGFTIDVAEELGIPSIAFRTISACCVYAYLCVPKLVESGEIPFKDEEMDRPVKSVPEMESFLRCRDLPSFCRVKDLNDPVFHFVEVETFNSNRANAHILNTFEDLEGPVLNQLRSNFWPNLYTIGPLHALLKSRKQANLSAPVSSNGLWEEDRSCMAWLDLQPSVSVVYVSFGSLTMVSRDQWLEFWYGLVNSGKRFLWVRRSDSFDSKVEDCKIPAELVEGTRERGYMVGWAPQEEVLFHPAVGGFLTHSGWNSTLESMVAGVPMICWPHFADQQINSRYVSEVWKNGLDMKDKCDRTTVEKLVRDVMEDKRDELMKSTTMVSEKARKSVSDGGSSLRNFEALVEFIRKNI